MLGNTQFDEDTIRQIIRSQQDDLFGADDKTLSEAESEVLNLVNRRKSQSDRTSLNDLRNHFTRKPYGWYPNAIWTVTAKLFKRGKIEMKQDSNLLEDEEALTAFLNSSRHANTLLEPQLAFDPKVVKALKQVYSDAFDEACVYKEAKDVANAFKSKLTEMLVEVNQLLAQRREYKFLLSLEPFAEKLKSWSNKEYHYFLSKLETIEHDLLDSKEDILDPIKRFMIGEQREIYDRIRKLLNEDTSNLSYVEGEEFDILKAIIEHPKPYTGNLVRDAKQAKDSLGKKVLERIDEERSKAIEIIKKIIDDFENKEEYKKLDIAMQSLVIGPFENELRRINEERYIAVIRDIKTNVQYTLHQKQLNEMLRLAIPAEVAGEGDGGEQIVKVHYIALSNVKVDYPTSELRTDEDVDDYIEIYKNVLKKHIKDKRRIQL